jgi:hypothetical protein
VLENPGSSKKCWGIRWGEASTQLIPQTFLPLCVVVDEINVS